jgi:hypothetical protein
VTKNGLIVAYPYRRASAVGGLEMSVYFCHMLARRDSPSGDVNVDGNDSVTTTNDGVGVVVVSTSARYQQLSRVPSTRCLPVGTRSHGDDPSGLRHLIVDYKVSMLPIEQTRLV